MYKLVLIRHGAATKVAALFYLVPPVTAVMSRVGMRETLSALEIAGFALAALGVGILALAGKGQISQVKAPTGIVDEAKSTLTAVKSAVARGKYNATARSSIDASEIPSPAAPVAADGTSAPRRASGATERD